MEIDIKELRKMQELEAVERLKILQQEYGVHKNVLKEFKENKTIYYSERQNAVFDGILYCANLYIYYKMSKVILG